VAYNLNVNKHRSDLGNYINGVIDPDAISKQGGVIFTGVSAGASASEDLDDILPNFDFNFGIGFGVHSTFGMKAQGYVTAALINKTPTFAINCGVEWHCGVKICESVWFVSACEGISAGFNAGFTGFIAPGRTYMNAYGEVYLSATLAWITFTIDPKLSVTYDTNKNPVFSASF
jgi:drug/metabolite transporter superfamily protein YnfA